MRTLRRILVAGVVLTLATVGLAMLGLRFGEGNPLVILAALGFPLLFVGYMTDSFWLAVLAQWGTCTLVGFVLLGLSGRLRPEPDLPPAPPPEPQPEPEPWRPPTAEEIARALSHPLTETPRDAPGLDDVGRPPPQSKK